MAHTSFFGCIVVGLVASLFSMASATPGTATFYTTYTPSACYGNTPEGVLIAAASDPLWNDGKICGGMFKVTCTGPTNAYPKSCINGTSVTVKIVDRCPNCSVTLDLSKEAFQTIADPVHGVVKIDYTQI